MSNYSRDMDGYSFSEFGERKTDQDVFDETENESEEQKELDILGNLISTDDIKSNFDTNEDKVLRPEEFGLRPDTKMKNIYCDKLELYEEIRKYQKDSNPTDKLGEMLIKIALHMSTMARFWRYSHTIKQEIVENAIFRMLLSIPKFNLKDKKKNPFGYLSMICYRDMLHSLKKHFKQDKVTQELKGVYTRKLSEVASPTDERLTALRQMLERNEEYNDFVKASNDKKYGKKNKDVDLFALSRKDQVKYARKASKKSPK